jgi:hypothetical protein
MPRYAACLQTVPTRRPPLLLLLYYSPTQAVGAYKHTRLLNAETWNNLNTTLGSLGLPRMP